MNARLLRNTILTGLLAAWAGAAENTIRQIQVRALDGFSADTGDVLALIGTKAGDTLNVSRQDRDIRALIESQRFTAPSVVVEPLDPARPEEGVRLVYVVTRRHRFAGPAAIAGEDYFGRGKIEELLDLQDGAFIDEQVLAVKCDAVRREYLKRYFPQTEVKAVLEPTAPKSGLARVRVTIAEGPRLKPDEYVFEGNQALTDKELRKTFGEHPWWNPRGWFSTSPYSEEQLAKAQQDAREAYLEAGYLDAKIAPARLVPVPGNPRRASVVFEVQEGMQYRVAGVAIAGAKLFPESALRAVIPDLQPGAVAARSAIQAGAKALRDYYGARGYVDTQVRPNTVPDAADPARATIRFDIAEGPLVVVRNVLIRGNERTRDKVVRREIPVSPGQIMDEVRIARSENRLRNLGLFDQVRHYTESGTSEASTNRDLVFEVKEGRTGTFMIGGGYSSVDQLVGYLQLQQGNFDILNWPNFTGGGQKARLGLEIGSNHQTYEVSWTEPWFLDRPLALTVDLYRRANAYDQYDIVRLGGAVGVSYPVRIGSFGLKYTLEQITLDSLLTNVLYYADDNGAPDPSRPFRFADEPDSAVNSALEANWTYDTRDRLFVPTRGIQASIYGTVAGSMLGGDNDVYRAGAQFREWFPLWWRHILSLRGRVESVDAYGDTHVPIYDRIFLGGGRTIRGVRYRDMGSKVGDPVGTDFYSVGGNSMALVSAEYTVPLFEALRVAAFTDAGSVRPGSTDYDDMLDHYCWTAGMGLRIDIPGFPIRFDYAWPLEMDDDLTRTERFVFWVGFE